MRGYTQPFCVHFNMVTIFSVLQGLVVTATRRSRRGLTTFLIALICQYCAFWAILHFFVNTTLLCQYWAYLSTLCCSANTALICQYWAICRYCVVLSILHPSANTCQDMQKNPNAKILTRKFKLIHLFCPKQGKAYNNKLGTAKSGKPKKSELLVAI